jgi:hypothetical protein
MADLANVAEHTVLKKTIRTAIARNPSKPEILLFMFMNSLYYENSEKIVPYRRPAYLGFPTDAR